MSSSAGSESYGQQTNSQPAYGEQRPVARNGLGVAALVLGILAVLTSLTVVGGILLGIAAIVLGLLGRGRAKRGEATNGGVALAGLILGLAGLLLSVVLASLGAAAFFKSGGNDLVDCLKKANNDQAKVTQCQNDFKAKHQ